MANTANNKKPVNDGIANTCNEEQVLIGIQPKRQLCYKFYKSCRLTSILLLLGDALLFGLTFISAIQKYTHFILYTYTMIGLLGLSIFLILLAILDKSLFLRKAPFDDWVYEIAEKRLGTSLILYDSKYLYIHYDRSGKEVDKREFVTEMSDKSVHYTYYYIKTIIDKGIIQVECKKRQPIPNKASFKESDDKFWNIVPMGLTINTKTQQVSAIGWYLNDQNKNDELYETIPSTSILINTI